MLIDALVLFFILLALIYWGYCIYHVTTSHFKSNMVKIIWTFLVLFFPISILFYSAVIMGNRNDRIKKESLF